MPGRRNVATNKIPSFIKELNSQKWVSKPFRAVTGFRCYTGRKSSAVEADEQW